MSEDTIAENKKNKQTHKQTHQRDLCKDALEGTKYFDIILHDDQHLECRLLDYSPYEILVETEEYPKLMIPKQSIKFYILESSKNDNE